MLRRSLFTCLAVLALSAGRAEAISVHDIIELSKAGLSEPVLLALIDVDRSVFAIDTATLKRLKAAGVSDAVIVAMIRSGRENRDPLPRPAAEPQPSANFEPQPAPEPQVVVIDHHDAAPQPQPYPVAVPVYVPVATATDGYRRHDDTVTTTLSTDQGLVRARVPVPANCVKAEPVYWGFGGKLRPGSWEPPPTVVCR
jgi:hypothetical protein